MDDLISRKALGIGKCNPDVFENKEYAKGWNDAIELIEAAPTIEAEPERHGEWLRENIRPKSYLRVCSMCKKTAYFCGEGCSYKFCPHCGAKMDAKEKIMLKPGDKVIMNNCYIVPEYNKGRVWTVRSDPWMCCGQLVVSLAGKNGSYAVDGLDLVEDAKEV